MASDTVLTAGLTVAQARRLLAQSFRQQGLDSPELDARLLTGHALGLDHAGLTAQSDRKLDDGEAAVLRHLARRRLAREPLARIVGIKEFWGLPLRISEATLVPRPQTETVVEAALELIDQSGPRTRALRVLDLGTGTGALLLALLTELPNATGIGTDISPQALETARANALSVGLAQRAEFILRDFRDPLTERFDLIVSNPPYIRSGDIAQLPPEVRRDPVRALDGGPDGLDCYRVIAAQASRLLMPSGILLVELGAGQEAVVAGLFGSAGLLPLPARADLAGIPRALACVPNPKFAP